MICSLALALAMDVSASVDIHEHRQQREGTAAALVHDAIWPRLIGGRVMAYEWGGPASQQQIVGWTTISGKEDVERFVGAMLAAERAFSRGSGEGTATGHAMLYGAAELEAQDCDRLVLDVSSDESQSTGISPHAARERIPSHITINALAIGDRAEPQWFAANVVQGPWSFVEQAATWEDYAGAILRKLSTELASCGAVCAVEIGE